MRKKLKIKFWGKKGAFLLSQRTETYFIIRTLEG